MILSILYMYCIGLDTLRVFCRGFVGKRKKVERKAWRNDKMRHAFLSSSFRLPTTPQQNSHGVSRPYYPSIHTFVTVSSLRHFQRAFSSQLKS